MAIPIIMPKFGQMTELSAIVEWRKKEGDKVAKGDILFAVETDKSVMEVESFEEGTLLKITVKEGLNVPVQSIVGFLGQPGEAVPEAPPLAPRLERTAPSAPAASSLAAGSNAATGSTSAAAPITPNPERAGASAPPAIFRISPRASALARECVINPSGIHGSGPGGRIVEKDVQLCLQARGYDKIRISPAAKQMAAREDLDLFSLEAAGESGRIEVADVQRAIAEKPKPMSKMRQVIAHRLTESVLTAPHFFVTVETDMTGLIGLRVRLKEQGLPYTVTDFISQAAVLALREFPAINSSTDGRAIRWHSHVHLGLAVSLDQGVVAPVVRKAEEMTLSQLSAAVKELSAKARDGRLTPDEMSGGTFTISNLGMLDVENFTAIINPGEAAILAVSTIQEKPVAREGQIVVRSIMKMTLSSDHRLVDGALAARFLNAIRQKLENLELWKTLIS